MHDSFMSVERLWRVGDIVRLNNEHLRRYPNEHDSRLRMIEEVQVVPIVQRRRVGHPQYVRLAGYIFKPGHMNLFVAGNLIMLVREAEGQYEETDNV